MSKTYKIYNVVSEIKTLNLDPNWRRDIRDRGFCYVRMEGLEPPRREALDPKSSASTNFATSAPFFGSAKVTNKYKVSMQNTWKNFKKATGNIFEESAAFFSAKALQIIRNKH